MTRSDVRGRLLESAMTLFSTRGFNAIGLKELVDSIGVPKGSFYAHFESKDALGCALIDHYAEASSEKLDELRTGAGRPTIRLRRHFEELIAAIVDSRFTVGCLLGRFGTELADQSPTIRARVSRAFASWNEALEVAATEAYALGELAPGVEPGVAAHFLLNSWEGAIVRALSDRSAKPLQTFVDVIFPTLFRTSATPVGARPARKRVT